jgi:hypothetical protein
LLIKQVEKTAKKVKQAGNKYENLQKKTDIEALNPSKVQKVKYYQLDHL